MVDDDKPQPSLEPPRLFGRRKKAKSSPPPPASEEATTEAPSTSAPEPVARPEPTPPPAEEPRPLFEDEPAAEPALEEAPGPAADERRRSRWSRATRVLPTVRPQPSVAERPAGADDEPAAEPRRRREEPVLTGYRAAAAVGLIAGGLAVLLTALSLRLCELVRGTTSCGTPGFLLLLAIFVAVVTAGGYLLRYLDLPDPFSTSFLAVGLVAVIALLFLIDVILAWPMIIVIPVLSALMYAASHWVTTTFVEPSHD